jgi:hypothetical protein
MLIIGDVHGKFNQYQALVKDHRDTIQVGDMGVGFRQWPHGENYANPPFLFMENGNHRFIRGNHDNPSFCKKQKQWIADGIVENDMMFVGGAYSIDKDWRHEGFDWWPDEELSMRDFFLIADIYAGVKPRVMITHDCPAEVVGVIHPRNAFPNSLTQTSFQFMFKEHQPELWIFGHHHVSFNQKINGTQFICLDELETFNL